jgi:hypothetical protein
MAITITGRPWHDPTLMSNGASPDSVAFDKISKLPLDRRPGVPLTLKQRQIIEGRLKKILSGEADLVNKIKSLEDELKFLNSPHYKRVKGEIIAYLMNAAKRQAPPDETLTRMMALLDR